MCFILSFICAGLFGYIVNNIFKSFDQCNLTVNKMSKNHTQTCLSFGECLSLMFCLQLYSCLLVDGTVSNFCIKETTYVSYQFDIAAKKKNSKK